MTPTVSSRVQPRYTASGTEMVRTIVFRAPYVCANVAADHSVTVAAIVVIVHTTRDGGHANRLVHDHWSTSDNERP